MIGNVRPSCRPRARVSAAAVVVIAVALLSAVSSTAGPPDDSWLEAMKRGRRFRMERDFPMAETAFRNALVVARGDHASLQRVIVTLQALGDALARQARSVEAESAYREAVELTTDLPLADFGIRSEALKHLAWFYEYDRRWADAGRVHRELLALVEDRYGIGSLQAAAIRHAIAHVAMLEGEYSAAVAEYETTLRGLAPVGFSDAAGRAFAASGLAFLADVENRASDSRRREMDAQEAFRAVRGDVVAVVSRSVRVREESFGQRHPALIAPLADLATALSAFGRSEETDSVRERIVDIVMDAGLRDKRVLATVLEQRARGLDALGRRDLARRLRAQASAIRADIR